MALMAGLGSLLGGLSNTKSARTGTQASTTGSTGTKTSTFNPLQTQMQGTVSNALTKEIAKGPGIAPMETSGTNAINNTYRSIGDRLQQSLGARGFGNSGASGTEALETELGRAGAVGGLEGNLQDYALQQQQDALAKALNFGFAAPGETFSDTGATSGSYTAPGSVAAGALSGGMTSLLSQLNEAALMGAYGG